MSGSSLDGLDMAICRFELQGGTVQDWALLAWQTAPYPERWQERLRALPQASARELAHAHADLGRWMGETVKAFLQQHPQWPPDFIASHGHTIFHFPEQGFTTQIGDGAAIAAITGIATVCDFRSTDLALGGQGAPLAPLADRLLFSQHDFMLNLGGIANMTCRIGERYIAFDVGGANQILNALAQTLGLPYDDGGRLAACGKLIPELKDALDSLPYFQLPPPKSLGNDWVQRYQTDLCLNWPAPVEDRLHTACVHIAGQIAQAFGQIRTAERWQLPSYSALATGGGAFNAFLVRLILEACNRIAPVSLHIPDPAIVSMKEAILMALMGALRAEGQPNCLSSVTGARQDAIGGAAYAGWSKPLL